MHFDEKDLFLMRERLKCYFCCELIYFNYAVGEIKGKHVRISLPPATKLGQGNIFRSVCQQFCPRGGVRGCLGGMHGFIQGGVRGFIRGVCVVLLGGHAWFYLGGVRGFIRGACMVLFSGGACVVFSVFSDTMRYGQ